MKQLIGICENEKLKGGLSDNKSLEDIAKHHSVDVGYIKKQLQKGIAIEKEHTKNHKIATEIAKDHLWEDKDYYIKLEKYVELDEKTNSKKLINLINI